MKESLILFLLIQLAISQRLQRPEPNIDRDSFAEVIRSKTFVDKSHFINMFFEREHIMYVTAPRGFGKTTLMNLLKSFCQIQVSEDGKPLHGNTTSTYKLFKDHGLAIMEDRKVVSDNFGYHPVAHFRFDHLSVGNGFSDFLSSFRDLLSEAYREHSYLKTSSFAEVIRSKTFVDKSHFINMFFEREHIMYVTAPRGFGKTTLMNLLKSFCQIQVSEDGKPLHGNTTSTYKLFKDHGLAIMEDRKVVSDNFGYHPVAHFRFDHLSVGNGFSDFLSSFRDLLSEAYREHSYLKTSRNLPLTDKLDYEGIVAKNQTSWMTQRGKDLTQLLNTHFGRTCIILIDDFDAPLSQMLGNKRISDHDVELIHDFLKGFLVNLVKVNFFHYKSLITASVRLVPPDVNSRIEEANNLITVNFAEDEEIANSYGFTDEDVLMLAKKFGKEAEMDNIRKWYEGYPVEDSDTKLYNIYSVLKYFETGKLTTHWIDSGNVREILKPFFGQGLLQVDIEGSLAVNNTKIKLVDGPYCFNTRNILILKDALDDPKGAEKDLYVKNLMLKYLTDHGYFPIRKRTSYKGYIEGVIPTLEVRKRLEEYLDENSVQQSYERRKGH